MSVRGFAVESVDAYGDSDAVLDFEITANRPDAMSVIGIAREVATAYGLQVRRPATRGREASNKAEPGDLRLASLRRRYPARSQVWTAAHLGLGLDQLVVAGRR